jgi:hypothetical protein
MIKRDAELAKCEEGVWNVLVHTHLLLWLLVREVLLEPQADNGFVSVDDAIDRFTSVLRAAGLASQPWSGVVIARSFKRRVCADVLEQNKERFDHGVMPECPSVRMYGQRLRTGEGAFDEAVDRVLKAVHDAEIPGLELMRQAELNPQAIDPGAVSIKALQQIENSLQQASQAAGTAWRDRLASEGKECCVCYHSIARPGTLGCGHVACVGCLERTHRPPEDGLPEGYQCPACRARSPAIIPLIFP